MYRISDKNIWTGRNSEDQLYFHEKIKCIDLKNDTLSGGIERSFGILGYACDEGVRRNQGRIGAAEGPDKIRKMLAPLANHFTDQTEILDIGNISCKTRNLEEAQEEAKNCIAHLLGHKIFPIVLGGGHDLAYAHYNGIKKQFPNKSIGIINLDAHFDLRAVVQRGNSGTPFYQVAQEHQPFRYLCLGIQKEANHPGLFKTADELHVKYLKNTEFVLENRDRITKLITDFMSSVDLVYLTVDMDGFSSVHAPGVSAPSPLGFSIDIALETIQLICTSEKLISADIVEYNPKYDLDNCTARLAARLAYYMMRFRQ